MRTKPLKHWLRTGEALCSIVAVTSVLLVSAAGAANYSACIDENTTYNFGPIENETSLVPGSPFGYHNGNGTDCTAEVVLSGGGDGFVLSAPPDGYTPSCLSSPTLSPGETCYFTVTFTPSGPGADTTTVTADVTIAGNNYSSYLTLDGAGFELSPEDHDESGSLTDTSGMCTGPGAPYACCSSAGAGACVDAFPLTYEPLSSPGYGYITFDPGNADITWKGTLDYQTSGKVSGPPAIDIKEFSTKAAQKSISFGTPPSPDPAPAPKAQAIAIAGGQLELNATYNVRGAGSQTNTITAYVTGIPASESSPGIPYNTINSELSSLYGSVTIPLDSSFSPYTPALMTQIAAWESRPFCQQFFDPPDNFASPYYPYGGVIDSWPVESGGSGSNNAGGGAHIGLMQVPVSQQNAWDWIQNARDGTMCPQKKPNSATCGAAKSVGKNSFQEKLLIVYNRMLAMQKGKSPALGALTSCQLEEMALAEYGPYSSGSLENQYYYAACNGTPNGNTCSGGNWQWTINDSGAPPDTNFCAICYAAYVRATYLPGGSLSSCGETSGSADPPALDCTGCTKLGAAAACY